jgi:hypothetical protein
MSLPASSRCLLLLGLAVASACGRDLPVLGDAPRGAALAIAPAELDLYLGQRFRIEALLTDASGTRSALGPELTFTVSRPDLLEVANDGSGVARGAGSAVIRARLGSLEAEARVRVRAARAVALQLEPPQVELRIGRTAQLVVSARLEDGSVLDVTPASAGTRYESADAAVASVSPDGLVRARAVGLVTLSVSNGALEVKGLVRVDEPTSALVALRLRPRELELAVGESADVVALGVDASGKNVVLPWDRAPLFLESGDPMVATVGQGGEVFAVGEGEATLLATTDALATLSRVIVSARGGEAARLSVEPGLVRSVVGQIFGLRVVATLRDGGVRDVTSSPDTTYAVVIEERVRALARGVFRAEQEGATAIVVRHRDLERRVAVEVRPAETLRALRISPETIALQPGERFDDLLVTASFADGTTLDVTRDAALLATIEDPTVAVWEDGSLSAFAPGRTRLRAVWQGLEANAEVLVDGGQPSGLVVDAPLLLEVGMRAQFRVRARFDGGGERDVTFEPGLAAFSSRPDVVGVEVGALRGLSVGQAQLTASYGGLGVTVPVEVVRQLSLTGLAFDPPTLSLVPGQTGRVRVVGTTPDGRMLDVSASSELRLTAPPGLLVSQGEIVELAALAPGRYVVEARYGGLGARLDLEVGAASGIVALEVIPAALTLAVQEAQPLQVVGYLADGTRLLVSGASFGVQDGAVASVDATGLVTGLAPGSTLVSVSAEGRLAQVPVTVLAPGPAITALSPTAVPVGSPPLVLTVDGAGFDPGDVVLVDGAPMQTLFFSPTRLVADLPALLFFGPGVRTVQVFGGRGVSNAALLEVVGG